MTMSDFQRLRELDNEIAKLVSEVPEEYIAAYSFVTGSLISFNRSKWLSDKITSERWETIARAWNIIEAEGDDEDLATMRTLLNRTSKRLLGYPLTVHAKRVVEAPTRQR